MLTDVWLADAFASFLAECEARASVEARRLDPLAVDRPADPVAELGLLVRGLEGDRELIDSGRYLVSRDEVNRLMSATSVSGLIPWLVTEITVEPSARETSAMSHRSRDEPVWLKSMSTSVGRDVAAHVIWS